MFLDNKYYKWYIELTSKQDRRLDCYIEKHHIVPRSMGGKDTKENLVVLTAREHYIAHLLLTKCVENKYKGKMLHAYIMMAQVKDSNQERFYKINSRIFEVRKIESDKLKREYKHTEKARESISKNLKGVPKPEFTEEHKNNISKGHKGQKAWNEGLKGVVKCSDETKAKMSESAKGRVVKDSTKNKLSLLSKNTIVCYDKIKDVVVKIDIGIFNKEKNIRYITTRTNEYKLIKQNKENLCQVA
jgi:HNH endonuclease.